MSAWRGWFLPSRYCVEKRVVDVNAFAVNVCQWGQYSCLLVEVLRGGCALVLLHLGPAYLVRWPGAVAVLSNALLWRGAKVVYLA